MATYNAYQGETGPANVREDGTDYWMAVEFYVTAQAWLTKIHFWQASGGTTSAATRVGALWQVTGAATGTNVVAATSFPATVPGWNTLTLAAPYQLTATTRYRAAVRHPEGAYSGTDDYYTSGAGGTDQTVGVLVVPSAANATNGDQNSYVGAGGGSYPNESSSAAKYWVDVTVTNVNPYRMLRRDLTGANRHQRGLQRRFF
jgi:hypothetical protein